MWIIIISWHNMDMHTSALKVCVCVFLFCFLLVFVCFPQNISIFMGLYINCLWNIELEAIEIFRCENIGDKLSSKIANQVINIEIAFHVRIGLLYLGSKTNTFLGEITWREKGNLWKVYEVCFLSFVLFCFVFHFSWDKLRNKFYFLYKGPYTRVSYIFFSF